MSNGPRNELSKAKMCGLTIIKSYQELPFGGSDTIFFCTDSNAVCRWAPDVQDWEAILMDNFYINYTNVLIDKNNNRKGAILAQKARKGR